MSKKTKASKSATRTKTSRSKGKKASGASVRGASSRAKSQSSVPIMQVKVVGVGGGGGNAVSRMSRDFVRGVEFIAINTDHQDLDQVMVKRKIYIGKNLTGGLGAGMNPDIGRQAAEENRSEIAEALKDADIVFVTAGLGGGTGSGAAPVIAEVARQAGALTFAVVTKPFGFEGAQRERIAEESIGKVKEKVDAIIVVPNDKVFSVIDKDTPVLKAFAAIDEILRNALLGVVELIAHPGLINVDFADVRAIVKEAGLAVVGVGIAQGQDRAQKAVKAAIKSPLLEMSAEGANGIILGVSGGRDLKMSEVHEAAQLVSQAADTSARIIFGAYHDRNLKQNQIKITLIATGFNGTREASSLFGGRVAERNSQLFFASDDLKSATMQGGKKGSDAKEEPALPETESRKAKQVPKKKDEDYPWDIPAFLRRKKR